MDFPGRPETEHPIQSLKDQFPFRLGTTSYILPADLVPNVEFLGPLVDDVELVLFESGEVSNLPSPNTIQTLAELKCLRRLSYTVHMPLDIRLGDPDEAIRGRSVQMCLKVIAITKPVHPMAYIVHFDGEVRGKIPIRHVDRWLKTLDHSVTELLSSGIEPERLCIETLDYPFEYVDPVVSRHGLSICLDVGHLAFYGYPIQDYLNRYLVRSRALHLHGHLNGVDHRGVDFFDHETLSVLTERLIGASSNNRILTLEVFGIEAFETSMEIMRRWNE